MSNGKRAIGLGLVSAACVGLIGCSPSEGPNAAADQLGTAAGQPSAGAAPSVQPGPGSVATTPGAGSVTPGVGPGPEVAGPGVAGPGGVATTPGGVTTTPGAVPTTPGAVPTTPATPTPAGPVSCSNADKSVIPIDETGWVARGCNDVGIQGAFYCYDDGVNPSGCTPNVAPYVAGSGLCLKGNTIEDETYAAWGAGIGFGLNETGKMGDVPSVKMAYDAAAAGLLGFNVQITGDTGGLPIRIAFTKVEDPSGPSPFVEVPGASPTPYEILIADATVPPDWEVCEGAECEADASSIYDMQIQVVGGNEAADFDFCVESIVPITDGSGPVNPGGAVADYGSPQCDQYQGIDIGPYRVQNNRYNGANHCIQAKFDGARKGGFSLSSVSANVPTGGAPASYPSLVYGWHVDGRFSGEYQSAKTLSSIGSIPTETTFTVPGSGRYNMAYDNWINAGATAANDQGTLEQMIWLNFRDTTPIGSQVDTVSIAGQQWEVWYGPNNGFNTVSYIRATNTTSATLDLKPFMDDTVARGYAQDSHYLLGIQAGFEIWEANQDFSVDSFSVSVN